MNILHITPHLGGGVKTVLLKWFSEDKDNNHTVVSLGYADSEVIQFCYDNEIVIYYNFADRDYKKILQLIPLYDIIIIHYWNFPLLIDFLVNTNLPECRLVMWCHNSGLYTPYVIPEKAVTMSDKFIFTSPVSYYADCIQELPETQKDKLDYIWSTGGIDKYKNIVKKEHEGLNILYAGTVDYAKMYKGFMRTCYYISQTVDKVKFIVCGEGSALANMKIEAIEYNIDHLFTFTGFVNDLTPYLEVSDIFLYLLNDTHFGTGEQILGEVLSIGMPTVVFDNLAESFIIGHNQNGLVADTMEEAVVFVNELANDEKRYNRISKTAKDTVEDMYGLEKMVYKWNNIFNEVIKLPKRERNWFNMKTIFKVKPIDIFLESLGDNAEPFSCYIKSKLKLQEIFDSNLQWKSKSKGSINQYLQYFKDDEQLKEWNDMVNTK